MANLTASYSHWISARYKRALEANVGAGRLPDVDEAYAQDARFSRPVAATGTSVKARTNDLFAELTRLRAYWSAYFDEFAKNLATRAADDWYRDNATSWQGALKRSGFDIKMQLTPSQKLILRAKVQENVSLIKSIPEQFHKDVEGIVLRNFTAGRDLKTMAEQIKARGDVTTRRAALIARDQSNKASAQMNAARQRELGIDRAVWIHSSAGKEPRAKHVKAGRERWEFDPKIGIDFGDGFGFVLPGEAINCRCISRSIIPAIGRDRGPDSTMSVEQSRLDAKGVWGKYSARTPNPFD